MIIENNALAPAMRGPLGEALFSELSKASWETPKVGTLEGYNVSYASHPGLVRARNEDRLALAEISAANGTGYFVAVVCDGVGGSDHGDMAATIAVTTLIAELAYSKVRLSAAETLRHAVRKMDEKVRECISGKGTTTASIIMVTSDGELVGANVGDSRIFSWGGSPSKKLRQVSIDDTLENELKNLKIDAAALYEKGLMGSLSKAIGEVDRAEGQLSVNILHKEDFNNKVMLASDGTWKRTPEAFELTVINAQKSIDCVKRIVALANWVGGVDNASVIVIDDVDLLVGRCIALCQDQGLKIHASVWFSEQKFVYQETVPVVRQIAESKPDRIMRKSVRRTPRAKKESEGNSTAGAQLDLSVDSPSKEKQGRRSENRTRIEISVEESKDGRNDE